MVLGVWKKRKNGRTAWCFLGSLMCLSWLGVGDLGAVELMQTGQGKVLVGSRLSEVEMGNMANSGSRDPFNWSAEFIDQYLARMRSKQDFFADLQISGIVWDPQMPLAIINNELLKEGEMINNVMVLKISKDSVLVGREGLQHTLNFEQRIIDLGTQ